EPSRPSPQPTVARVESKKTPAKEESAPSLVNHSIFSVLDDEEEVADDEDPTPAANASEELVHDDVPSPLPASQHSTSAPALTSTAKPASPLQATLKLHQDEVARFKGTDKTIVEGEDLDVPTWMRMKQKIRR
ncbi:MAG: hypothetical protein WCN98_10410, partial [Verrucomicrobiaceae bacterium]